MEFKDRLKMAMDYKKITAYAIGRDTSISKVSIRNYLRGTRPAIDNINILSKYLNVSVEWLLTGAGEMIESNMSHSISGGGSVNARYSGSFNDVKTHIGNNIKSDAESIELEMLKKENDSLKRELALKNELLAEKERLIKMILKE